MPVEKLLQAAFPFDPVSDGVAYVALEDESGAHGVLDEQDIIASSDCETADNARLLKDK